MRKWGGDTIIITFTTALDFYDCDTDEKLSSPYEVTVPKGSLVKVPTFKNDYTHWEDEGGATYEGCGEYTFSEDTALVDGGR